MTRTPYRAATAPKPAGPPRMTSTKVGKTRVEIPHTSPLRSISTRLMTLTAALVLVITGLMVWQWTSTAHEAILEERRASAKTIANTLSSSMMNELDDNNWSQIRVFISLIERDDEAIVYVAIHGDRAFKKIVAATPQELNEQYFPDLVPADVTRAAREANSNTPITRTFETYLLRDVWFVGRDAKGNELREQRGARGEEILEVAATIRNASNTILGVARVGINLTAVDAAVRAAYLRALAIGGLALLLGLVGSWFVARRLARPIRHLSADATKIAAGNLAHRSTLDRADEIGALAIAFNNMTHDLEESFGRVTQTVRSFERFVPRKFLAVIAPEGIENIQVGTAALRRVSVLFCDLRGFTTISESLTPQELFELLNDYLARMGAAISAHGGFVDKYIGDAIMALFDDEHTDAVLRAIIEMRRALSELNRERLIANKPIIEFGIGAHSGEVVMGTIGFPSKIESTVIGDAVNVASRVEAMTKEHGVDVLVTSAIVERLFDKSQFVLEQYATGVRARGRDEPIDLFTLQSDSDRSSRRKI